MNATDLRAASFRGIEFACRVIGGSNGRRVQVNEYPGLDDVTVDDLGRAIRSYRLEAVITGADWLDRYRALLQACEQEGSGELVHPEGFRKMCVVNEPAEYSVSSVGEAIVVLSLVEVSESLVPSVEVDGVSAVQSARALVNSASSDQLTYAWESVVGSVAVLTDAIDFADELIRLHGPGRIEASALVALRDIEGSVLELATAPADMAAAWAGYWQAVADPTFLEAVASAYESQAASLKNWSDLPTEKTQALARNAYALSVANWAMSVGALADAVAATDYAAYDDAWAAVDATSDQAVALEGYADDSALVLALTDLRAALVSAVLVQAQELPRLKVYTPGAVASTVEIAQRLYQDGTRGDEIAARNRVQHPGFCSPNTNLRVLAA